MANATRPDTAGSNSAASATSSQSRLKSLQWIRSIRALPSTAQNDFLRTEYIEANFNNSRKLIQSLNDLESSTSQLTKVTEQVNDGLIKVKEAEQCLHKLRLP